MSITTIPAVTVLISKLSGMNDKMRPYRFMIFLAFVACLYGFLLFRIGSLTSAHPAQADIDSQVKAAQIPHFDQAIIDQLQSLQDNSENVQTLFNEARNNPF